MLDSTWNNNGFRKDLLFRTFFFHSFRMFILIINSCYYYRYHSITIKINYLLMPSLIIFIHDEKYPISQISFLRWEKKNFFPTLLLALFYILLDTFSQHSRTITIPIKYLNCRRNAMFAMPPITFRNYSKNTQTLTSNLYSTRIHFRDSLLLIKYVHTMLWCSLYSHAVICIFLT